MPFNYFHKLKKLQTSITRINIFPTPTSNNEYPECDGIRGIAIILVYWFHYLQIFKIKIDDSSLWNLHKIIAFTGGYGVQLFFVLSAYLLFLPQYSRIMAGGTPQQISHFAIRRFLRIAPLYYLTIIAFIWFVDVGIPQPERFKHTIAHLFFVHIFFPETVTSINNITWSLGPEFIFYLTLPLLLYIIFSIYLLKNAAIRDIALFAVLFILSVLATIHGLHSNMIFASFISFYLGIFAALVVYQLSKTKPLNKKTIRWMGPIVLLSIISLHYCIFKANLDTGLPLTAPVIYTEKFWLISILYALCIIVASQKDYILYPALSFYPVRLVGLFSYEIYLIHVFMMQWLSKQPLFTMINRNNHFLNGLFMFFIITIFGGILHAIISRPFIKISNLMIRRKPGQPIPIWMIIMMISFMIVTIVPTIFLM